MKTKPIAVATLLALALVASAVPAAAQGAAPPSQILTGQSLQVTAEIVAFDPATRAISLRGPLGSVVDAVVSEEVKDISRIQPGTMVSATMYGAIAASMHRKGEAKPLFSAADIAAKAQPGQPVRHTETVTETLTVFLVDLAANSVVLKDAAGTLESIDVVRPEFQAKLRDLKVGDQIDVSYSIAVVTQLMPLAPGEEAKAVMKMGSLVIDRGEVVKRLDNVLLIRNERGRMIRVGVDPSFKFNVNGKDVTVAEIQDGTRLTRTVIRVQDVAYSN